MSQDRRDYFRVSESRLITEIICENPFVSSITNLSSTGIFTVKPAKSGLRGPRIIQMEIPLPEASETVWATGQVMYETMTKNTIGSGIKFLNMAAGHKNLLNDLLEQHRQTILTNMMQEIKWRKDLAAHPSPYTADPPSRTTEDTVKMYLLPERL